MAQSVKEGKNQTIPISAIEVDKKWNSRHAYGKDAEGEDWPPFVASFDRGQDTDIIVMLNLRKNADKPYFLVSGHRRLEALSERAATPGLDSGTVRADVRSMSWSVARETNLRENAAREGVSAADTAWALKMLQKDYEAENRQVGQNEMANALGKTQAYVNYLLTIVDAFDTPRITRWRNLQTERVSYVPLLKIARELAGNENKDKRYAAFDKLVKEPSANGSSDEGEGESKSKDWLDRAIAKAEKIGAALAEYEAAGLCTVSKAAFGSSKIAVFVSAAKVEENSDGNTLNGKLKRVLSAGEKAYDKAKERIAKAVKEAEEAAAAEAAEEAAAAAAKKGKKGKKEESASAN
jgi:hypothetical protein